ncbi:hypothetical protein QJS04_geneDACA022326 [Acorus gramineus]|uniref:Uncharacterized protein n=1 Tax=Acorus gramineus TaxID=55184 RepID=A0AAV9AIM3_ACOGR|nr:hypothetical protein QJS04_geneDACA022326 [Acorus gramineus]
MEPYQRIEQVMGRLHLRDLSPRSKGFINILKFKGMFEGIKLAIKHRQSRLWTEGDSSTTSARINGKGSPPWQAFCTLLAIKAVPLVALQMESLTYRSQGEPAC